MAQTVEHGGSDGADSGNQRGVEKFALILLYAPGVMKQDTPPQNASCDLLRIFFVLFSQIDFMRFVEGGTDIGGGCSKVNLHLKTAKQVLNKNQEIIVRAILLIEQIGWRVRASGNLKIPSTEKLPLMPRAVVLSRRRNRCREDEVVPYPT